MAEFALGWQTPAAERIEALFRADAGAKALVWYGSRAAGDSDEWSDVDALVVLDEDAIGRYHPDRDWLGFFGPEIAARSYANGWVWVHRAVFAGFRRADLVMTTEANLRRVGEWPFLGFARADRRRVAFSRSATVDEVLVGDLAPPRAHYGTDGDLPRLAERMIFGAVVAIEKWVRGDRLIATEWALEMSRQILILAMVLRDREAGTTYHPRGEPGDGDVLAGLPRLDFGRPLGAVEAGLAIFEALMVRAEPGYVPRGPELAGAFAAAQSFPELSRKDEGGFLGTSRRFSP